MYWTGEIPPKCKTYDICACQCFRTLSHLLLSQYYENPSNPRDHPSQELPELNTIHSKKNHKKKTRSLKKVVGTFPLRRTRDASGRPLLSFWAETQETTLNKLHFHLPHLDSVKKQEEGKQRDDARRSSIRDSLSPFSVIHDRLWPKARAGTIQSVAALGH